MPTHDSLVAQYGAAVVEEYIKKVHAFEQSKGIKLDLYKTVAKWIEKNGIMPTTHKEYVGAQNVEESMVLPAPVADVDLGHYKNDALEVLALLNDVEASCQDILGEEHEDYTDWEGIATVLRMGYTAADMKTDIKMAYPCLEDIERMLGLVPNCDRNVVSS